ncbi:MAG: hypothetical protein K5866_03035 [Treponema sp.]|nr:hypothetical protein [Treponema sp.]
MAIQPIDLQTMYQQQANISKIVNTQQQAALTEQMQQENNIQKNIEKNQSVQKTQTDKTEANKANEDGSNSSDFNSQKSLNKQNQKKKEELPPSENVNKYTPPNLGKMIDISS